MKFSAGSLAGLGLVSCETVVAEAPSRLSSLLAGQGFAELLSPEHGMIVLMTVGRVRVSWICKRSFKSWMRFLCCLKHF